MKPARYPALISSTSLIVLVALTWAMLRFVLSPGTLFPLSYVLPLLVVVWTRRVWHVWLMAAIFATVIAVRLQWQLSPAVLADHHLFGEAVATYVNILMGAVVVHAILILRDRLDAHMDQIEQQNRVLQEQADELRRQNEEIKAQAEELVQQNSEIESQAEEMERQNQELQEANERLASREEVLHAAVESSRAQGGGRAALEAVGRRTLEIVGDPARAMAILELKGGRLRAQVQVTSPGEPLLPHEWPLAGSLGQVVIDKDQTAYVDDLEKRPDLAAPLDEAGRYRSALATPIRIGGRGAGVLVLCSDRPTHWTQEHFRLAEWAAAQCAPLIESVRWQEALQERAATVEAANRAKDDFLAMLSHELRTPLTPVLAAAGALEQDPRLPEDVRAELAMIQRNVAVQSRLIDDLLDLTRIARGKLDLNHQVLDIHTLLRDAAGIVAAEVDANEQRLELDLDLPEPCTVFGDGARLQQVFWNLLKNAIKFSPRRGRVQVRARVRTGLPKGDPTLGQRLQVQIVDEGVGIAPADLERIFQPFEQAAAARRRGGNSGLGLGLSIARAIVDLHEGVLTATSPGAQRGSVFTVELPLTTQPLPRHPALPPREAADPDERSGPPLHILLVEDHRDTGMVMARLLRRSGYTVVHAQTLSAAQAAWKEQQFDLLISDLGLPDGSGLDLMREIRTLNPDTIGICMSGFGMESDVEASRSAGFSEHLIKPVDMQQLHSAIRRITLNPR